MNEILLLNYYYEYKQNSVTRPFCLYKSLLETDDLVIWEEEGTISFADKKEYLFRKDLLEANGRELKFIYETTDMEKIIDIKKALGDKDYDNRLERIYMITQREKVLALK